MEKKNYITNIEHEKCKKAAKAYAELEQEDIILVDVGRYGFLMLQYFQPLSIFDDVITFTESKKMFDFLWDEWLYSQLIYIAKEMQIVDIDYDDVFDLLTTDQQQKLLSKRNYFLKKASMI